MTGPVTAWDRWRVAHGGTGREYSPRLPSARGGHRPLIQYAYESCILGTPIELRRTAGP